MICVQGVVLSMPYAQSSTIDYCESPGISGTNTFIAYKGMILDGDYEKFINKIKENGFLPEFIQIESQGGDVIEAMKIGELVRDAGLIVIPRKQCDSACALIYFASVNWGSALTNVGLHRPYYSPRHFSKLNKIEAENEYKKIDGKVREYLRKMNIPTATIDKIMTIASDEVVYLRVGAFVEENGDKPPAFDEWIKAKCGALSQEDEHILELAGYKLMFEKVYRSDMDSIEFIDTPEGKRREDKLKKNIKASLDIPENIINETTKKAEEINSCISDAKLQSRKEVYKNLGGEWSMFAQYFHESYRRCADIF